MRKRRETARVLDGEEKKTELRGNKQNERTTTTIRNNKTHIKRTIRSKRHQKEKKKELQRACRRERKRKIHEKEREREDGDPTREATCSSDSSSSLLVVLLRVGSAYKCEEALKVADAGLDAFGTRTVPRRHAGQWISAKGFESTTNKM